MEQKYKVRDLAKELNVSPNEIIDIVKEYFDVERKVTGVVSGEELDVVFEKLSQSHQVKSFNTYFNTAKPEAKKAAPAAKENVKTEKSKAELKKEESKKEEPKAEVSKEQVKKAEPKAQPKQEAKPEVKAEAKPAVKQEVKPVAERPQRNDNNQPRSNDNRFQRNDNNQTRSNDNRFQRNDNNQPRSNDNRFQRNDNNQPRNNDNRFQRNANNQPRSNDNRFQRNDNNQPRNQQPRKPAAAPKPIQPQVDLSKIKTNEPPKTIKDKAADAAKRERGEQVTKRVDTRGTYVNLDKYNERYESIAPQGQGNKKMPDSFTKKQKINQKSKNNQRYGNKTKFETEAQKLKRLELEKARKQQLKVQIPDEITVGELAARLKVTASEVIKKLFNLGIMASINQTIDYDTAAIVADELGAKVEKEVVVTIEERLFEEETDKEEDLLPRSPVVVVMGHVDHGKTSLLDRIRNAHVVEGEAGGITQHIGAYRVKAGERDITFLDTPGHEAFTAMRARGANLTDIAILVVAADDGIMPQTIEAINHAKAAGTSIIVAINKIDKEGANPERVKQELTEHGLVCEEWGGDTICVNVSAKKGEGIDELLEMVNLTADVLELKANPNRLATGAVIEARLDKGRGPIATLLVENGTLHSGDVIIAGTAVGRVRVMTDDKGRKVKDAGPSIPVEIMGLAEVPNSGDKFAVVEDEKLAKELVEKRKFEAKEEQFKLYQKVTLDNLFEQIEEGEMKELPIIVKADVQGSVEAVTQSLEKLSNNEVRVKVIHGAVGAVSESDVMLANASNAIIVGFNVRPNPAAAENAKRDGVDIRLYRIIYDAIEEITTAMKGMLAPKFREVDIARVEVRQVYKITNVGVVAGSYVLSGKITRGCDVRVVRDGIVVAVDKLSGLKRFKDDAKEVAEGYECGISLEKYSDIKEGDIFEAFVMEEYQD